jgi:hypothetical protein
MSFSKKWDKLQQSEFTTFRYPRADTDWFVGEIVQIFFKNRSPSREKLGIARIVNKEKRELDTFSTDGTIVKPIGVPLTTEKEAQEDGFKSREDMVKYMEKQYGLDYISLFDKLTLRWLSKP